MPLRGICHRPAPRQRPQPQHTHPQHTSAQRTPGFPAGTAGFATCAPSLATRTTGLQANPHADLHSDTDAANADPSRAAALDSFPDTNSDPYAELPAAYAGQPDSTVDVHHPTAHPDYDTDVSQPSHADEPDVSQSSHADEPDVSQPDPGDDTYLS